MGSMHDCARAGSKTGYAGNYLIVLTLCYVFIILIETQSVTYRTEKCGICSLKFAEKNKHCDQDWLGCEECETWIHL